MPSMYLQGWNEITHLWQGWDDKYLSGGMDGMRRIHLVISPVIPVSEVSPPSHKSYLGGTGVIPATASSWLSSRPAKLESNPKNFPATLE
jgi:hypothetical protein